MRAIVIDPAVPHALRLSGGPEPIPRPGQVLVDVQHVTLNPAEVHLATDGALPPGLVPGWEASGVVIAAPGGVDQIGLSTPGGAGPRHSVPGVGRFDDGPAVSGIGATPRSRPTHRSPGSPFQSTANPFGLSGQGRGTGAARSRGLGPTSFASSMGGQPGRQVRFDAAEPNRTGNSNGSFDQPVVGSRVVTRGRIGAWAQRRVVDVDNVAVVPDGVDLAAAVALPVAATTALGAIQAAGPTIGRRILVTGAAGGVGRFAVQLAAIGGAYVIASVDSEARAGGLRELGAHEVVVGLKGITEPVDVILDGVGGSQMVEAFALLAPGGCLQSFGWTSEEPAVFPPFSTVGPPRTLSSFSLPPAGAPGMSTLLSLVATGRLRVEIGWRGSWERYDEAIEALLSREVSGKAVLDVT